MDSLTTEQRAVFHHLLRGKNLFLTGGGGVGKSYLLSVICEELPKWKKQWEGRIITIQMCAMTGCAALLLSHRAKTLHSWSGIGLGKGTTKEIFLKIRRNSQAMRRWLSTDLLIIDEISMMTAELLDKLNELAKLVRKNKRPFGGIQLVLVGDFYQLPPIRKALESDLNQPLFAFEAESWSELVPDAYELTQIMRQKDEAFQTVLKEARVGKLSQASCAILEERYGQNWRAGKIRPTLLFPRRAEVDLINDSNFRELKGRRETYEARLAYSGKAPVGFDEKSEAFQRALQQFDSDAPYNKELSLVEDAQVMLIANIDPTLGLVNGSRGVIIGFCEVTSMPIVEFVNGVKEVIGRHSWPIEEYTFISRTQVPLRLAYALTIHKAQGASLDCALVDIGSGNFEFGQAYVALSRVRSLEALYVYDFDPTVFKANGKVVSFYSQLHSIPIADLQEAPPPSPAPVSSTTSTVLAKKPITVHKQEAMMEENDIMKKKDVPDALDEKEEPGQIMNWLYQMIPDHWKEHMTPCEKALESLSVKLSSKTFLPAKEDIWRALEYTPLSSVKVVILGQDPYPTVGHAHGLSFSVQPHVKPLPASLQNIYKEMATDLGMERPDKGHLRHWAEQGILLLNTVLTVEPGSPQSHSKLGWEEVTDHIIHLLAKRTDPVLFILWGKSAQAKKAILRNYPHHPHHLLESAHPSPLSAHKGFFGTRPFSATNQWLESKGLSTIQWA
jgi:ATP-dependent DNA helicase PIF1